MSVVPRQVDGKAYLHVRRHVNGKQKQRFIKVEGLEGRELALKKHEANKLDTEWAAEQGEDDRNFMGQFWRDGRFLFIRLTAPNNKNGWHILATKTNDERCFSMSRAVSTHGIDRAFNQVFNALMKYLGFSTRSTNVRVLRSVWLSHIKAQYQEHKTRLRRRCTIGNQRQQTAETLCEVVNA